MNVGTLTISLTARTAALLSSLSKVRTFESGVMSSVQRINRSVGTLGQSLSVLSLPLIAIGGLAVKKFADFEYSLAKITGLAGVASQQVQAWTKDVLYLSQKTGESAQDLADALYFVASSGIKGAKTLEVLEVSAYGAMAGLGKTKDIANLLTSVINAYGEANVDTAHTMDVLVAAVREGKAEAVDMAKSLGMVVNVAAELGISFENVASAVAATTRTGVPVSTSVTQLRQLLFSFLKERPMVENALESMGMTFQEVRDSLSEDLLTGLIKLRAVTSAWGEDALGRVLPNVRAFNEALSLTGVNVLATMRLFKEVQNPTDAFNTAVAAVENTIRVKFNKAMSTLNNSLMSFGASIADDVLPMVKKFTDLIAKLFGWFSSLDEKTQNIIVTITVFSAVLGPMLLVVSSFVSAMGTMVSVLTNPLGLILAIAAAIGLVVRNLDIWEKAWPRIAEQMKKGGLWILKIVNNIAYAIQGTFSDIFNAIAGGNPLNPLLKGMATAISKSTENIGKRGIEIQNMIEDINTSLNGFSPETFIDKYNAMLQTLGGIHPKQRNSMISLIKRATAASLVLKEYNPEMSKADPNLAYGMSNAISDSLGAEFNKITGLITSFTDGLNSKFGAKLNIGDGTDPFLEYQAKLEIFEDYVNQVQDVVKQYGGVQKAFGDLPGFTETTSGLELAQLVTNQVAKLNKEVVNVIANNGDLRAFLAGIPDGLKEFFDPKQMGVIYEYLNIYETKLKEVQEQERSWAENAWIWKSMGQPMMKFFDDFDKAKATLAVDSTLGMNNFSAAKANKDAQIQYWESIKQASIEAQNTFKLYNPNDLVPQVLIDNLIEANKQIDKLTYAKFTNFTEITSSVISVANAFTSLGDTIKSVFEDGQLTFSEFVSLLSSGFSIITSLFEAFNLIKTITTALTVKDTVATSANTGAQIANATALGVANMALSATNASLAVSGALAASAWVPFPGNLAAMTASVTGVMTGLGTIPAAMGMAAVGLKEGGIIPGGYPNDTFSANLSSNEAVIPLERLPQLLGIGTRDKNQQVEFIIEGRVLKGILKDAETMGGLK